MGSDFSLYLSLLPSYLSPSPLTRCPAVPLPRCPTAPPLQSSAAGRSSSRLASESHAFLPASNEPAERCAVSWGGRPPVTRRAPLGRGSRHAAIRNGAA